MKNLALLIMVALLLASCSASPASQGNSTPPSGNQSTSQLASAQPFNEEQVRSQLQVKTYLFDTGFHTMQAIVIVENPTNYDLNIACNIKMLYEDGSEAKSQELTRNNIDKKSGASFISTLELDELTPAKMEYELVKVEEDISGNARLHNFEIKEEKTDNGEVVVTVKNISDEEQYPLNAHMFTFKGKELMAVKVTQVGKYLQAPDEVWVSEPLRGTEPVEDTWKFYYFSEQ